MRLRSGVVVNALALRRGGGLSSALQLLARLPDEWTDVLVLAHPTAVSVVSEACRALERDDVEVRTYGWRSRTTRVIAEHTLLPLALWRRGYRTWIGLGNAPAALWPGRPVVLLHSIYAFTPAHDSVLATADRVTVTVQRLLLRVLKHRIAGIIYPSRSAARAGAVLLPDLPFRVCPWGVEARPPEEKTSGPEDRDASALRLVMVSTVYRHKNIEPLVTALSIVQAQVDATLTVVGATDDEGFLASIHALSRKNGVERAIRWRGELSHGEALAEIAAADVYVLLSTVETFGMTWLEAQALGVPVVAPDVAIAREVLGGGAVFVDAADPAAVASGILDAARRRSEIAAEALRNVERYHVEKTAAAFYEACDELLA